jgi:hypothetical protein
MGKKTQLDHLNFMQDLVFAPIQEADEKTRER